MSSVHPSTGPPDLNLVLTHMDSSLVNKLMCCAKAVADGDLKRIGVLFEEIEGLISEETNEATKKVVEYFAEALVRRVHGLQPRNPMPLLPSIEMQNYPYTQEIPLHLFATIATNYDTLETLITRKSKQVHFIDFSMVVSYRYWRDCFLYGKRVHCSQSFRVTSIRPKLSRYDEHLQPHTCQQLITPLASQYDIDFQCEEVFANSAAEIVEAVLNLKRTSEDETIIVRWVFKLHKLLAQEGAIEKVLSKVKDLRPDIMVIVEQEANHNSLDFFNRFSSSFDYYHSVFEASERNDTDPRVKLLSEMHLRRQISNVVASEGIDRFERHETLDRWQERLTQAGFHSIPLRSNELKNHSLHPMSEFIIVENNGFPMLRFLKRPLAVVSVWKPGFVAFHMGRHSGCDKQKLRKGFWSPEEDEKLVNHITKHGSGGSWSSVPKLAGLRRCSKSCRLRWINYLRPDLKKGTFSEEEKDLIIKLHSFLGNRWSVIASLLPGRTDNDVKNSWNSFTKKKLRQRGIDPDTHRPLSEFENDKEKQQQLTADKSNEKVPVVSNELNLAATLKPPTVSSSSSKIINIQDTDHASPPLETEGASSSDSEDDIRCHPDAMTNGTIWSEEETKRIVRWMDHKMTGAFAGLNKRLNVRDTSLKNLLSIPLPFIPIEEEKQYYVDDSVINAFFKLLGKISEKFPTSYIKNYSLPTWIMSFLLSGKWSETKALSSSKIKKIVGTLKLFIPVCLEDHWILICVDIKKRALLWLDSLNSTFYGSKKTMISEWIIKHLLPSLGYDNSLEWQFQELLDISHQSNLVDCGIFIIKYADCLAHGDHFPFTQENVPHFRRRVFLYIYRGRLSVAVSALNLNRSLEDTNGTVWTPTENKLFQNALVVYDKDTPDRWLKVAAMILGKTVDDVIKLYRELEEDVSDIEAGLIPPPSFPQSDFVILEDI